MGLNGGDEAGRIAGYVRRVMGADIWGDGESANIEDVFTHLEVDIERSPSSELLGIRAALLKLIQMLLTVLEERIPKESDEYDNLVREKRETDTFITYNWDLLLDNALGREKVLGSYYGSGAVGGLSQYANFVFALCDW